MSGEMQDYLGQKKQELKGLRLETLKDLLASFPADEHFNFPNLIKDIWDHTQKQIESYRAKSKTLEELTSSGLEDHNYNVVFIGQVDNEGILKKIGEYKPYTIYIYTSYVGEERYTIVGNLTAVPFEGFLSKLRGVTSDHISNLKSQQKLPEDIDLRSLIREKCQEGDQKSAEHAPQQISQELFEIATVMKWFRDNSFKGKQDATVTNNIESFFKAFNQFQEELPNNSSFKKPIKNFQLNTFEFLKVSESDEYVFNGGRGGNQRQQIFIDFVQAWREGYPSHTTDTVEQLTLNQILIKQADDIWFARRSVLLQLSTTIQKIQSNELDEIKYLSLETLPGQLGQHVTSLEKVLNDIKLLEQQLDKQDKKLTKEQLRQIQLIKISALNFKSFMQELQYDLRMKTKKFKSDSSTYSDDEESELEIEDGVEYLALEKLYKFNSGYLAKNDISAIDRLNILQRQESLVAKLFPLHDLRTSMSDSEEADFLEGYIYAVACDDSLSADYKKQLAKNTILESRQNLVNSSLTELKQIFNFDEQLEQGDQVNNELMKVLEKNLTKSYQQEFRDIVKQFLYGQIKDELDFAVRLRDYHEKNMSPWLRFKSIFSQDAANQLNAMEAVAQFRMNFVEGYFEQQKQKAQDNIEQMEQLKQKIQTKLDASSLVPAKRSVFTWIFKPFQCYHYHQYCKQLDAFKPASSKQVDSKEKESVFEMSVAELGHEKKGNEQELNDLVRGYVDLRL